MSKQKTVLVIILLIIIAGLIVLNVFIFLKKKEVVKSPEEVMKEVAINLAQEMWKNPESPAQSLPLKEEEVPKEAVRISISSNSFLPSSLEVQRGQKVVLVLANQDNQIHIFRFKEEYQELATVGIGLRSDETKAITFYAPQKEGEYEFSCVMWGHREKGEKGKMVVK